MSRVGGNAQIKAMKEVAGTLRLDLAQFRAMQAFAQFASDLDKATQMQLARGVRLVEVLKQGQYSPIPVEEQIVIIYAATKGFTDDYEVEVLGRYEKELISWLKAEKSDLLPGIREKKTLKKGLGDDLESALKLFNDVFDPARDSKMAVKS